MTASLPLILSYLIRRLPFAALPAIILLNIFFSSAQQPANPPRIASRPPSSPIYLLNLTPEKGGKSFTLYHNTKVNATLSNGEEVRGKVKMVSRDSIFIGMRNYAITDITIFKFNPGSAIGAAAAIGAVIGIAAIAVTADGGKDKVRSDGEDITFFSGIGLTAVSGALLIPNYFIKKKFPRTKYQYRTVKIGGY